MRDNLCVFFSIFSFILEQRGKGFWCYLLQNYIDYWIVYAAILKKRSNRYESRYVLHSRLFKESGVRKMSLMYMEKVLHITSSIFRQFAYICSQLIITFTFNGNRWHSHLLQRTLFAPFTSSFRKPKLCVKIMQISKDFMSIEGNFDSLLMMCGKGFLE